jgi:hypothetical protein
VAVFAFVGRTFGPTDPVFGIKLIEWCNLCVSITSTYCWGPVRWIHMQDMLIKVLYVLPFNSCQQRFYSLCIRPQMCTLFLVPPQALRDAFPFRTSLVFVNESHSIEIPKAQIIDINDHELVTLGFVVVRGQVLQEFVN